MLSGVVRGGSPTGKHPRTAADARGWQTCGPAYPPFGVYHRGNLLKCKRRGEPRQAGEAIRRPPDQRTQWSGRVMYWLRRRSLSRIRSRDLWIASTDARRRLRVSVTRCSERSTHSRVKRIGGGSRFGFCASARIFASYDADIHHGVGYLNRIISCFLSSFPGNRRAKALSPRQRLRCSSR